MKLVTYNVRFCHKPEQLIKDFHLILSHDPDYICLQEYVHFPLLEKQLEEKGYRLLEFEYNRNAAFSQSAVIAYKSHLTFKRMWSFIISGQHLFRENEYKGVFAVLFETGKVDQMVINVHLPTTGSIQARISRFIHIMKYFRENYTAQILLCGDFNLFHYQNQNLEKELLKLNFLPISPDEPTFTLIDPMEKQAAYHALKVLQKMRILNRARARLDFIFANTEDLKNVEIKSEVLKDAKASDHVPVLVETLPH